MGELNVVCVGLRHSLVAVWLATKVLSVEITWVENLVHCARFLPLHMQTSQALTLFCFSWLLCGGHGYLQYLAFSFSHGSFSKVFGAGICPNFGTSPTPSLFGVSVPPLPRQFWHFTDHHQATFLEFYAGVASPSLHVCRGFHPAPLE